VGRHVAPPELARIGGGGGYQHDAPLGLPFSYEGAVGSWSVSRSNRNRQFPRNRSLVAQISNLLDRGFPIRWSWLNRRGLGGGRPAGRVELGDTADWKSALPAGGGSGSVSRVEKTPGAQRESPRPLVVYPAVQAVDSHFFAATPCRVIRDGVTRQEWPARLFNNYSPVICRQLEGREDSEAHRREGFREAR